MLTTCRKMWRPPALGLAAAVLLLRSGAGAERGARREAAALRRLPWRGRQLQDGEIPSLAGQPAFFVLNQLVPDARGRAQGRGDGADRQGPEGRGPDALSEHFSKLPAKPSGEPIDPALAKRGEEIADAPALQLLSPAEPRRLGAGAADRQAADRLSDPRAEGVPRWNPAGRRHCDEREPRRNLRRRPGRAGALLRVKMRGPRPNERGPLKVSPLRREMTPAAPRSGPSNSPAFNSSLRRLNHRDPLLRGSSRVE